MGIRYRTQDVPPGQAPAFTPVPTTNPVASSYGLVHIYGSPGTDPQPAPGPARQWGAPSLTKPGGVNSAQGSNVVPDYILPAIYVADVANMGPAMDTGIGMTRRRFNELPIPARDPGRLPVPVMMQFPTGGRKTFAWPRAFQVWPTK